jgi:hypothetical protein
LEKANWIRQRGQLSHPSLLALPFLFLQKQKGGGNNNAGKEREKTKERKEKKNHSFSEKNSSLYGSAPEGSAPACSCLGA